MVRRRLVLILVLIALLIGLVGYLLGRGSGPAGPAVGDASPATAAAQQVYTCSMHPQVRLDRPGNCPICSMPLVPATATAAAAGPPTLQFSEHELAMASVQTAPVTRRPLWRELRALGKIQVDETSLATVTARVDGYAERLFVNVTGVEISAGDHLAEVYSPDLLVGQQELLIALQGDPKGTLAQTTALKLRRWGLTQQQIDELVNHRKLADRVTLYSPASGTVLEKMIVENSAFAAGDVLYRIANLDTVWVYLDIYEPDLPWIRFGQAVTLTAEAIPGRTFSGTVTFIQPIVSEETRTIRVPVYIRNQDHALKPGMFVSAVVNAALGPDGRAAATGAEGQFTCPMHPQVLQQEMGNCPICEMPLKQVPDHQAGGESLDHMAHATAPAPAYACPMHCQGDKTYPQAGNCPVCGMNLQQVQPAAAAGATGGGDLLAVPVSAVLDSGTRKIVYVEKARGLFEQREIIAGPRAQDYYPVLRGLSDGQRVVVRGGFLIDSQFQITGHPSLFYPGGLEATTREAPAETDMERPMPPGHKH